MGKIERMRAALAGEAVDHVPASFWFHFEQRPGGRPMAEAHLDYYRRCDPDWLKVMMDTGYDVPAGFRREDGTFNIGLLDEPVPLASRCYEHFFEGYELILKELREEAPTIVTVFSPYATLHRTMGKSGDKLLGEQPDAVEAALGAIAESLAGFARQVIAMGAWGIYFSAQAGERDRFTDEQHARFIEPYDRAVLQAVTDAPFNLLHCCGQGLRMETFWTYPAGCINWAAGPEFGNPTIAEGRERTDLPIAAGMHFRGPVAFGPEDALRAEVRRALAEGGRSKFLLAAGCTVPNDVDWRWLRIAREECITCSTACA